MLRRVLLFAMIVPLVTTVGDQDLTAAMLVMAVLSLTLDKGGVVLAHQEHSQETKLQPALIVRRVQLLLNVPQRAVRHALLELTTTPQLEHSAASALRVLTVIQELPFAQHVLQEPRAIKQVV